MLPSVLRRREPAVITTEPAPVLGPAIDAPPEPAAPPRPIDAIDRGVCWHPAHVDMPAGRFGVTPLREREHLAALTRCSYSNQGGS